MSMRCEQVQSSVVEQLGDQSRLDAFERRHVAECSDCARVVRAEQALAVLLGRFPEADEALQRQILAALPPRSMRYRLLALLPVAAAAAVIVLAVFLIGGLPGGSVVSLLSIWSSQGWLTVSQACSDLSIALLSSAGAAQALLPSAFTVAAGALAALGLIVVAGTTRRVRRSAVWRLSR